MRKNAIAVKTTRATATPKRARTIAILPERLTGALRSCCRGPDSRESYCSSGESLFNLDSMNDFAHRQVPRLVLRHRSPNHSNCATDLRACRSPCR